VKLYTRDEYSRVLGHVKDGRVVHRDCTVTSACKSSQTRRRPQDRTGPAAGAHPSSGRQDVLQPGLLMMTFLLLLPVSGKKEEEMDDVWL